MFGRIIEDVMGRVTEEEMLKDIIEE